MSPAAGTTSTDPRVARSRARILAATLDELADRGWTGLAIEGIASRAGVGKATVYRHFDDKATLVAEAIDAHVEELPTPDTGTLRADVLAILGDLAARSQRSGGSLFTVLLDAAERDAELASHRHAFVRARRRPLVRVLQAGIARGELPATADCDLLADLLAAPIFYRRYVSRTPVDDSAVEAVVDAVLPHATGRCTPSGDTGS